VKRAAAEIANTFTRELYHEVIKLVTPLAISADGLQERLAGGATVPETTRHEIARIERQVQHLRAVLDAMRSFTAIPTLKFERESLREIADEAARLAQPVSHERSAGIDILLPSSLTAEVARTRLIQALTNLLTNAIEACDGLAVKQPIRLTGWEREGHVGLVIEDFGCGMSKEATVDARALFATSKPHGTGFGVPLAVKIVETEHCGRLTISSEKGRGTRIEILLPMERAV
jgi:two-component system sensor histidine kinase HydH